MCLKYIRTIYIYIALHILYKIIYYNDRGILYINSKQNDKLIDEQNIKHHFINN